MEPTTDPLAVLNAREKRILELIGRGKLNKEIALTLSISASCVGVYVYRICRKIGAANRCEIMAWWLEYEHGKPLAEAV